MIREHRPDLLAGFAISLAVAAVLLGTLLLFRRQGRPLFAAALLLLTAADLAVTGRWLVATRPPETMSEPPRPLRALASHPPDGPVFLAMGYDQRLLFERERRVQVQSPVPAQWGLELTLDRDIDVTHLLWTVRSRDLFLELASRNPALAAPLLERRGVAAVIRFRPDRQGGGGAAAPSDPIEVLAVPGHQPRAFFADRVVAAEGNDGWKQAVLGLGSEARSTAIVEAKDGAVAAGPLSTGSVNFLSRRSDAWQLEASVAGPGPGFLAVNQTWDRYWSATIDGRPAPILRTDVALMGIVVPAGNHRVELRYRDPLVDLGVAISLGAAALLALFLLVPILRRRAPRG